MLIGIFVKPVDRVREYWCDPEYTKFIVELVHWVESKYPTIADRAHRGIMGASLGGLISLHIAYEHPRVFGRVATQSGAFYNEGRRDRPATKVYERVKASRIHPLRLHLSCGYYEGLLVQNRALNALLGELKVDHAYDEHPQGHTWTLWRDTLPEILDHLWKR
jgi:enterochelin esterase family protein